MLEQRLEQQLGNSESLGWMGVGAGGGCTKQWEGAAWLQGAAGGL